MVHFHGREVLSVKAMFQQLPILLGTDGKNLSILRRRQCVSDFYPKTFEGGTCTERWLQFNGKVW
jgi:hypothetical protein